tara:strand:+ start:1255 stop:2016 length:762 start_codon:yes stop_codon:yes gene_type:complete
MFEKIYHEYLLYKNEQNRRDRYEGKESWYHASGAGFCSRKLYFESVEKAEPTNPVNKSAMRKMALGTVLHEDIQNALIYYNNIKKDNINNNINKDYIVEHTDVTFDIEGEIELKEFNVRGYYDVVSKGSDNIGLFDIKTTASFSWKQKFSRAFTNKQVNRNHFLQIGTYGIAVERTHGRLDEIAIIYYNKDTSAMRRVDVPLDYVKQAKRYWMAINEEHSKGLPGFQFGTSPAYAWCCNYCQFKDHCKPPSFK